MSNLPLMQRCIQAFAKGLGADKAQIDFDTDDIILKSQFHKVRFRRDDFERAILNVIMEVEHGTP